MKVLLAIDGSPHSGMATDAVANRPWPKDTMIQILTIVHPSVPLLPDPPFVIAAIHEEQSLALWHSASAVLEKAAGEVGREHRRNRHHQDSRRVSQAVDRRGGEGMGADLIVLGSHGYGRLARLALGSVAGAVVANAPCSVQIVGTKEVTPGEQSAA